MQFATFSRDRSPHSPGSPWSSFLRQSPGLYTTGGVRSSSLPGTPSELRSTLGHEENPFSESFGAAPVASTAPFDSNNIDAASADVDHLNVRPCKKRALSVSAVHDLDVNEDAGSARGGKELKRDPFAVASFSSTDKPAPNPSQRTDTSTYSRSNSDASKVYSTTPETSVGNSPKPTLSLLDQLSATLQTTNDISYKYFQPAPSHLEYTYQVSDFNHDPHSLSLGAQPTFDFDNFTFQPYTPTIPLLPVINPFDAVDIPRSSVSFTPDPMLEVVRKEETPSATASPSPAPEPVVAAPKKRGRRPRDPNAPVDQEKVAKARLSALERNRIAASKSRAKKKEKAASAESAVSDLCTSNSLLQSTALTLRAELLALRARLDELHPSPSLCTCHHIKGYLRREAEGGGIPTLERLAGQTLARDYSRNGRFAAGEPEEEGSENGDLEVGAKESEMEAMPEGRVAIPLRRVRV